MILNTLIKEIDLATIINLYDINKNIIEEGAYKDKIWKGFLYYNVKEVFADVYIENDYRFPALGIELTCRRYDNK